MKWEAASAIRIGGREEQQDSLGVFSAHADQRWLLVVADGMGGHRGGFLASHTLLEVAGHLWNDYPQDDENPQAFLENLCQEANRQIFQKGLEYDLNPLTTVVALLITETKAHWVHVGDSRLYHFRGSSLVERTKDHSLLQILVDTGEVEEEEMGTHPDQNQLLRAVGEEHPAKTTHGAAETGPEDRFLLCSDGFWEQMTPTEMGQMLAADTLQTAVNQSVETAAERGGPRGDNISLVAVRVCSPQTPANKKNLSVKKKISLGLAGVTLLAALALFLLVMLSPEKEIPGWQAVITEWTAPFRPHESDLPKNPESGEAE